MTDEIKDRGPGSFFLEVCMAPPRLADQVALVSGKVCLAKQDMEAPSVTIALSSVQRCAIFTILEVPSVPFLFSYYHW